MRNKCGKQQKTLVALVAVIALGAQSPVMAAGKPESAGKKDAPAPSYSLPKELRGLEKEMERFEVVKVDRDNGQRGDPKTDYDQKENRLHSAVQRERAGAEPDPSVIDLGSWAEGATSVADSGNLLTVYTPPAGTSNFAYIRVEYDAVTLEPVLATGVEVTPLESEPELTDLSLSYITFDDLGGWTETYLSSDLSTTVSLHYSIDDLLLEARIEQSLEISLDSILF